MRLYKELKSRTWKIHPQLHLIKKGIDILSIIILIIAVFISIPAMQFNSIVYSRVEDILDINDRKVSTASEIFCKYLPPTFVQERVKILISLELVRLSDDITLKLGTYDETIKDVDKNEEVDKDLIGIIQDKLGNNPIEITKPSKDELEKRLDERVLQREQFYNNYRNSGIYILDDISGIMYNMNNKVLRADLKNSSTAKAIALENANELKSMMINSHIIGIFQLIFNSLAFYGIVELSIKIVHWRNSKWQKSK